MAVLVPVQLTALLALSLTVAAATKKMSMTYCLTKLERH